MRTPFNLAARVGARSAIAAALGLSLTLAACGAPASDDTDDLPDAEITGEPEAATGEQIDEAVPGVEAASPEGETPNTADLDGDDNLETAEPGDLEEE